MKTCKHEMLVKYTCMVNGEKATLCYDCTFLPDEKIELVEMVEENKNFITV